VTERAGRDEALVALVTDRWHALVAYAFLLAGDGAAAEDLVAEAVVRTFTARLRVDPASVEGYVRRAVLTIYIDGHRRRGRWRERLPLLATPDHHDGPETRLGEADEVRAALALLPRRQRACVVLRFYDEMSVAEVAATLGLAEGTVKRYLAMAMQQLQARLGPVAPPATAEPVLVRAARAADHSPEGDAR
jgi:RNA polymerase sigma-70 factor (ECF subfamily)